MPHIYFHFLFIERLYLSVASLFFLWFGFVCVFVLFICCIFLCTHWCAQNLSSNLSSHDNIFAFHEWQNNWNWMFPNRSELKLNDIFFLFHLIVSRVIRRNFNKKNSQSKYRKTTLTHSQLIADWMTKFGLVFELWYELRWMNKWIN